MYFFIESRDDDTTTKYEEINDKLNISLNNDPNKANSIGGRRGRDSNNYTQAIRLHSHNLSKRRTDSLHRLKKMPELSQWRIGPTSDV